MMQTAATTSTLPTRETVIPRALSPILRVWGSVAVLVVVELMAFSLRFPVGTLIHKAIFRNFSISFDALNNSMFTPRLISTAILSGVAATLLFGAGRLGRFLVAEDRPGIPGRLTGYYLAGHALAFVAFLMISGMIEGFDQTSRDLPVAWTLAWVASGLISAILAVSVALPPSSWWPMARAIPGAIAAGLVIALITPAACLATASLWASLGKWTLLGVVLLLRLVHAQVEIEPGQMNVGAGGFVVNIAPSCSGYEGIGLVLAFLLGFLWYERRQLRWPLALVLLPVGVVTIWLCNTTRIAALVTIGAWGYPKLAVEGFHSQAGSIGFTVITLGLVFVSRFRVFRALPDQSIDATTTPLKMVNPVAPYLVPQLAIIAASMVGGIFAIGDGLDRGYPIRVVAGMVAFAWYRRSYRGEGLTWSGSPSRWGAWLGPASGLLVFGIWMAMEPSLKPTGPPPALVALPGFWVVAWVVCRVVGSVILVPLAEELAFRGFLARRLMSSDFESINARRLSWLAMVVSSACFAALHGRWLAGGLAGMIYALTYRQRGRLADAVIAHATTNGLIAAYVLGTGLWSLW